MKKRKRTEKEKSRKKRKEKSSGKDCPVDYQKCVNAADPKKCVTTHFPKTMTLEEVREKLVDVKMGNLKATYFNRKGTSKTNVANEILTRFQ